MSHLSSEMEQERRAIDCNHDPKPYFLHYFLCPKCERILWLTRDRWGGEGFEYATVGFTSYIKRMKGQES